MRPWDECPLAGLRIAPSLNPRNPGDAVANAPRFGRRPLASPNIPALGLEPGGLDGQDGPLDYIRPNRRPKYLGDLDLPYDLARWAKDRPGLGGLGGHGLGHHLATTMVTFGAGASSGPLAGYLSLISLFAGPGTLPARSM